MALRKLFKYILMKQHYKLFYQKIYPCNNFHLQHFNSFGLFNSKITNGIDIKVCYCRYLSDDYYNTDIDENEFSVHNEMDDQTEDQIFIRNILYPNSQDPLILQLNECASVQDVFNIIRKNHQQMNETHISQAVLVLWDLQKIFYEYNGYFYNENNMNSLLYSNAIIQNYMNQVNSHDDFDLLIKLIEENYQKFTLDALTCTLLYLNRMGVQIKANVMQLMIMRAEKEIQSCDKDTFPLTSLSRFIVTVFSQDSLYPLLVSVNTMPIILHRLKNCDNEEDFKLLTICLHRMIKLVSMDILEMYKQIGMKLIDNNIITSNNRRTILKVVKFLKHLEWFHYNSECSNKFMRLFKGNVSQLETAELVTLFKVFLKQMEPAEMLQEIQDHASKLLNDFEIDSDYSKNSLDLLSCTIAFSSPLKRPKLEKLLKEYLKFNLPYESFITLYQILYSVKTTNSKLCNQFWDKYLKFVLNNSPNKLDYVINLSSQYLHFCYNIGYHYRNPNFENTILKYLFNELNNNIMTLMPSNFSIIATFSIVFSENANYNKKILDHLIESIPKFTPKSCLYLSKGFHLFQYHYSKKYLTKHINLLNQHLNKLLNEELQKESSLPNINLIVQSYNLNKGNNIDEFIKLAMNYYMKNSNQFTSNIMKDLVYCLKDNNYLLPELMDKITHFAVEKNFGILGSIIEKILNLCYILGYTPENLEEFLHISLEIIKRDKDRFSGLRLLKSYLALCFYEKLPEELIKEIFSVDFLENLDEELSNCYAKAIYPLRVRRNLMELNRAVCIDYPQLNIPWFHQKYIDKQKTPIKKDYFLREVHDILTELVNDSEYTLLENTYSPYGYYLNYELQPKNCDNKPNSEGYFSKTAILILNSNAYTNCTPNLKGFYQLKQRHLEILGYNILNITYKDWKTFYTHQNCKEFIRNLIWPTTKIAAVV